MTTEQECYERELASLSSVFTGFDRVTMYEEANTWYKIAKLHFDHGWHHQSMSCYFKAGNCYSKAIEAYDQVLVRYPKDERAEYGKIFCLEAIKLIKSERLTSK